MPAAPVMCVYYSELYVGFCPWAWTISEVYSFFATRREEFFSENIFMVFSLVCPCHSCAAAPEMCLKYVASPLAKPQSSVFGL